jgi:hypothetical protein
MKYTRELLQEVVKESYSVAQVLRKLGLRQAGGTHSHLSRRIKAFGIDTSLPGAGSEPRCVPQGAKDNPLARDARASPQRASPKAASSSASVAGNG